MHNTLVYKQILKHQIPFRVVVEASELAPPKILRPMNEHLLRPLRLLMRIIPCKISLFFSNRTLIYSRKNSFLFQNHKFAPITLHILEIAMKFNFIFLMNCKNW